MTVIATLCDWLMPVSQPMRSKPKTNQTLLKVQLLGIMIGSLHCMLLL